MHMRSVSSKIFQIDLESSNFFKSQLLVDWYSHWRPGKENGHTIAISFLKSVLNKLGAEALALEFRRCDEFTQLVEWPGWTVILFNC